MASTEYDRDLSDVLSRNEIQNAGSRRENRM